MSKRVVYTYGVEVRAVCEQCTQTFTYLRPEHHGHLALWKLCTPCRDDRENRQKLRYRRSGAGVEADKRWRENNPERALEIVRDSTARRRQRPEVRQADVEYHRRYMQTPAGKKAQTKANALRFGQQRSGSPYVARLAFMFDTAEACVECGETAKHIDHIFPLALGRVLGIGDLESFDNYQPLCSNCHRTKTNRDVAMIAVVKRRLKGGEAARDIFVRLAVAGA
jgi:5-methylcytosine-specific restriction endonuclease McrA